MVPVRSGRGRGQLAGAAREVAAPANPLWVDRPRPGLD